MLSHTVVIGDFNFPTIDWNDSSMLYGINHHMYFCRSANTLDLLILDKPETVGEVELYE